MGFRVQGSGFRVQGSGFKVQGSGFKVQGSRFGVQGSRFRVLGPRFRVQGSEAIYKSEYRITNNECRMSKEGILSIYKKQRMTKEKEDQGYDLEKQFFIINSALRPFFFKKSERSDSALRHSIFSIRYSKFAFSEFLFRSDRQFFWPAAGLKPDT
jgi:hypothetical protein